MDYTIEDILAYTDKPLLYVDYNELLDEDLVMLAGSDIKNDYFGNPVTLYAGLEAIGYQEDEDMNGARDDIIMEGTCVCNQTGNFPHVKWLLKANENGIRYASDIVNQHR